MNKKLLYPFLSASFSRHGFPANSSARGQRRGINFTKSAYCHAPQNKAPKVKKSFTSTPVKFFPRDTFNKRLHTNIYAAAFTSCQQCPKHKRMALRWCIYLAKDKTRSHQPFCALVIGFLKCTVMPLPPDRCPYGLSWVTFYFFYYSFFYIYYIKFKLL